MVLVAVFAITSCEKEEVQTNQSPVKEMNLKSEGVLTLTLAGSVDWICGSQTPCNNISNSFTKNNRVNITATGGLSNVKYTYYRCIQLGTFEVYQFIPGAQFSCSNGSVSYAAGYLNDNTKILVFANTGTPMNTTTYQTLIYDTGNSQFLTPISLGSSVYNYTIVTTGNYKGKPCGVVEPPCSDCNVN